MSYLALPAPMGVSMKGTYNPQNRQLYVSITGKQYQAVNTETLTCSLFLTEDSIATTKQSSATGTYYHPHVLRYVFNENTIGTAVSLSDADSTFTVSCVIDLDASWNEKQMQAIAFVAGYDDSDFSAFNVFNAAVMDIDTLPTVSVPESSFPVGYATGAAGQGLAFDSELQVGAAIAITPDMLKNGSDMVAMRFYLPVITGITNLNLFVTKDLNNISYAMPYTPQYAGWQYAAFTPVQEAGSSDTVYVGYFCNAEAGVAALAYETVTSAGLCSDYYCTSNSAAWKHLSTDIGQNVQNTIQVMVTGGNYSSQPQYDAVMNILEIGTSGYVRTNRSFDITLQIKNNGVRTMHSFDLQVLLGSQIDTLHYSQLNIANGESYPIVLSDVLVTEEGLCKFRPYVFNANDGQLEHNRSDNVKNGDFYAFNNLYNRKLLVEQFTSQSCSNCPSGTQAMYQAIGTKIDNDVLVVAHHAGYVNDIFTQSASRAYASRLGISQNPMMVVNRMKTYNDAYAFHPGYLTSDYIDELLAYPSPATITMAVDYNEETRQLHVTASGYCPSILNDAKLFVFLTENNLVASQESGGSNYSHKRVFRGYLTQNQWGDTLRRSADGTFEHSYEYTLPEQYTSVTGGVTSCTPANIKVVAFVSDDSGSAATCEVYNATQTDLMPATGIDDVLRNEVRLCTVSDHTLYFLTAYVQADIFAANGMCIGHAAANQKTVELPQAGVYVIRATLPDNSTAVQKIVITK